MSASKYHDDDRVKVIKEKGKVTEKHCLVKRTSIMFNPKEMETPHGTAVIATDRVYAKKSNGQLERIDKKKIKGKAMKKEYKRIKMAELRIALEEKACKL